MGEEVWVAWYSVRRGILEKANINLNHICEYMFAKIEHEKRWAGVHIRHTKQVRSVTWAGEWGRDTRKIKKSGRIGGKNLGYNFKWENSCKILPLRLLQNIPFLIGYINGGYKVIWTNKNTDLTRGWDCGDSSSWISMVIGRLWFQFFKTPL